MSELSPQSPQPTKRPPNRAVQIGAIIGIIVGVIGFQVIGMRHFERPPGGGINWMQVIWAGLIGGISAALGAIIGAGISALRKKPPPEGR